MADELRLGADMAGLARLYPWLEAAAAGLPDKLRHDMHVALEEAVVNVAMHALPADARDGIVVRLERAAGPVLVGAVLVVEDNGTAFNPVAAPDASGRDAPGGLGLKLLRHFCRDVRYERAEGVNRLTMRFRA
jgi:serine/threonine-protein kinase RsbW